MDGAAGAITAHLRELQGFHHHALTRERGVTVNQHRHHFIERRENFAGLAAALHPGAHRTFHHRISDFQMRRIERQRQVHRPTGGFHIGGKAHVIFHVAGAAFRHPALALKFLEQFAGRFADDVDQHVEATAMGHADHHFPHPLGAG